MGKWVHRLSDKDFEMKTAICAHCGPVELKQVGQGNYRCENSWRTTKTIADAKYRQENAESISTYQKQWAEENREKRRDYFRLKNYGLTPEDYQLLLDQQGGVCAICGGPPRKTKGGKQDTLHIDHDHDSMQVRGLLCGPCNVGLGSFQDDPVLLMKAWKYLKLKKG
jgi:hypothetical protein